MDFYPQDLLVGVFPLVFAVNAIVKEGDGGGGEALSSPGSSSGDKQRTLFDRFLDVVAASLVDAVGDSDNNNSSSAAAAAAADRRGNRTASAAAALFHASAADEDESSDEDDALSFGIARRRTSSISAGFYAGFGRRNLVQQQQSHQQQSNATTTTTGNSTAVDGTGNTDPGPGGAGTAGGGGGGGAGGSGGAASYAKALTHGQGFFQCARIETVSPRHGFPPSKDPLGTDPNSCLARSLSDHLKEHQHDLNDPCPAVQTLLKRHPIGGVLTAGWLEKHVHALPSVLIVVCTVSGNRSLQTKQDQQLREAISHLRLGLSPKRQCQIHVVGLMLDDVSLAQGDSWNKAVSNDIWQDSRDSHDHQQKQKHQQSQNPFVNDPSSGDPFFTVTLLRASTDLQAETTTGRPSSLAFRRLHQSVRDASMVYYLRQARRTKDKLGRLLQLRTTKGHSSTTASAAPGPPPQLLPLVVRYCFKIAMFYEFQWKFEKSLRFMVEAYRYNMRYYEYLLVRHYNVNTVGDPADAANATTERAPTTTTQHSVSDTGDSYEVSLSDRDDDRADLLETAVPVPDDMIHQCRAVAEWLNLKLLQAGFASHTEGGLLAAANQWRHHCRLFGSSTAATVSALCRRRDGQQRQRQQQQPSSPVGEAWWEWSYIARQRLVMSQLVERHPPKALGDLGNDWDEVIYRCSPWRTYESAVEATLRIARELDRPETQRQLSSAAEDSTATATASNHGDHKPKKDPMRGRYVGGLDSEGLLPELRELCRVNHRAKALEIVFRAIALYEHESEKEKRGFYAEDNFSERSSSRAGARLYYLAGGILLGMERHQEAVVHLEKASKFSRGWRELEVSIRRMLIECYEKHLPSSTHTTSGDNSTNEAIASMILDAYFNADMSPRDLRRALGHFASISGGGSLKWHHETIDEVDMSLPFSFAVSFPGRTHATAGGTVEASVLITSNLDYAVHVNSVVLLSLAGQLPIPSSDLLCATNVSEGSEGGIIIQSKTSIIVSTQLELPRDTSIIAVDDSGNGGEMQGVAGKGSFAKSARPRTAGITSAGGARLLTESEISQGNRVSQGWSIRFLGGKPLRCDGIRLVFYPVQVERVTGSAEAVSHIELTIRKKKPTTLANIKRTPFEEENYIASAWSRPLHFPLSRGPRTLRVLGPMPELLIKDMTEEVTGGKVVEGTVNRILLKFTAGSQERCNDITYRVSCFSVLITPDGTTRRLVSEEEMSKSEGSMDMKKPSCRTPTLVAQSEDPAQVFDAEYGYSLPQGWRPAKSGQSFTGPTLPLLACGESKYVEVNFYRPAPLMHNEDSLLADDDENVGDVSLCKTDYYVTVSYRQERAVAQKTRRTSVRGRRRRPVMGSGPKPESVDEPPGGMPSSEDQEEKGANTVGAAAFEEVSLEFTGSVVWGKALKASFQPGARRACPSGNRSKSNSVRGGGGSGDADELMSLVEGESITARCSFQADSTVEGLKTEIIGVRFEDNDSGAQSRASFTLQSSKGGNLIYSPALSDPCRVLSVGSKLSVAYTVKPNLTRASDAGGGGAKSTLGTILVDWKPSSLPLPSDARLDEDALGGIHSHGPLRLSTPSTIRFSGPACWIESAPFEATAESTAAIRRMGVPFRMNYRIKNKTSLHQLVSIHVMDPSSQDMDGLIFSGMTNGELSLAPSETQMISFTILATRAGKARLPALEVTSNRYQSWIIREASNKDICIFP